MNDKRHVQIRVQFSLPEAQIEISFVFTLQDTWLDRRYGMKQVLHALWHLEVSTRKARVLTVGDELDMTGVKLTPY